MRKTIYYMGFNAHLHLIVQDSGNLLVGGALCVPRKSVPPQRCGYIDRPGLLVLNGADRHIVAAFWSAAVLHLDDGFWHLGFHSGGKVPIRIELEDGLKMEDIKEWFGDLGGVIGAIAKSGDLLILDKESRDSKEESGDSGDESDDGRSTSMRLKSAGPLHESVNSNTSDVVCIECIVVAGNEQVCLVTCTSLRKRPPKKWKVSIFANSSAMFEGAAPIDEHHLSMAIHSATAGATAFALLLEDGGVLTFGSRLHPAMLARSPTTESPAEIPCQVDFLGGIAIQKIEMNEWLGAALSTDQDLYIWGGRVGEVNRIDGLPGNGEDVMLVNIDNEKDVTDFAIGMGHILVLTAEGAVWACGSNQYGQVKPLSRGAIFKRNWRRMKLRHWSDEKVVSLRAGGWGSWVNVEEIAASSETSDSQQSH